MGRDAHLDLSQDRYSSYSSWSNWLGLVPIGEASVIIAISSDHRTEGLEAVHWTIDELKATVPIWKKEFYADGSVWKGNAECRHGHRADKGSHSHHHKHDDHEHEGKC